jgi:5-methylcytosine-specific restriction endonuclease McrA
MFIQNKYTRIYYSLIKKAQIRIVDSSTYIEKHHIIPKSFGGTNKKENLVALTAREHFICHWLLTKMVIGEYRQKMLLALSFMQGRNKRQQKYNTQITSKVYDRIRKEVAEICNIHKHNRIVSDETKRKISIALTGKPRDADTRKKISDAHIGKKQSTEHAQASALARTGLVRTEETKQKMRKKHKPLTSETKHKMSKSKKGRTPWNKGLTKDTDERVRQNGVAVSKVNKGIK